MTIEEAYNKGYNDGIHDGYYSTMIEDGREEKQYNPPEVLNKDPDIKSDVSLEYINKKEVLNMIHNAWFDTSKDLSAFDLAKIISFNIDMMKPVKSSDIIKSETGSKWVKLNDGISWWYACEKCHAHILKGEFGNDCFSKFCPSCGEYMQGVDDTERPYVVPYQPVRVDKINIVDSEVTINNE